MTRTILITGATKGIGLATAQRLQNNGYDVIGIARNEVNEFPGQLYLADLADPQGTQDILKTIQHQKVDGVVNNVGDVVNQTLEEIDLTSLQAIFDINVRTAVQVTQAFIGQMKEQGWGRVINISSRTILGRKGRTSYSAAKCALIGSTRTWALECAEFGITVNAIAPGPIETELYRRGNPTGSKAEGDTLASVPMRRVGEPREVAAAISFLLSEDAGYITGQTLCVDGGGSL